MQHSTSDQTRTPLGDVPNTNVDNMGGGNHPTALMDTAALRARLLVIKESVKEGMQGMPPELQESAMRACELEVLPDFALGDDTYAAAPGVVRGFLSQYTSVPGELVMPADGARPEEVDIYLSEVITFLRTKFEEKGVSGDNFHKLFAGGRGGFSLVANAHIYTHQVQVWFVLEDRAHTEAQLAELVGGVGGGRRIHRKQGIAPSCGSSHRPRPGPSSLEPPRLAYITSCGASQL
jgi:hypothetical protein